MPRRFLRIEGAFLVLVLFALSLRYAPAIRLSWTYDDPWLLRLAARQSVASYFTAPAFWQSLPQQMFVPFIHTWFDVVSHATHGSPAPFYVLSIVWLDLALAASYLALRTWFGPVSSLVAVAMIGLGPPVVSIVTQLMSTHYLFALTFSALSIAAWSGVQTTEEQPARLFPALLSSFFYFLAILAKEIAVPLPVVLLLLPRSRPRSLAPHALALALYLLWRKLMIGAFLGGYGWVVTSDSLGPLLRSLPRQVVASIAPPQTWIVVLLALVLLLPIAWRMRSWKFAVATALSIAVALGPVIPVSREMQPRFVFALWVTLVVLFVISIRSKPLLAAMGVAIVAIANVAEWRDVYPVAARMSDEARFVLSAPSSATLRLPRVPPAAMGELLAMRDVPGVQAFYDDFYLCSHDQRGRRVFEYESGRIVEITTRVGALARRHCGSIRKNVPLQARFRFDNGTLSWRFGPYTRGAWSVLFGDGAQAFPVPRRDAFKLGNVPGLDLRIRYDSPEGWRTYSETIHLHFTKP